MIDYAIEKQLDPNAPWSPTSETCGIESEQTTVEKHTRLVGQRVDLWLSNKDTLRPYRMKEQTYQRFSQVGFTCSIELDGETLCHFVFNPKERRLFPRGEWLPGSPVARYG